MVDRIEKLKENRTSILLGEIGAYLHDLGKARKEFLEYYSQDYPKDKKGDKHNFPSIFPEDLKVLLNEITVKVASESCSLLDFIEKHHKERESGQEFKDCEIPKLVRLLYAGWNGYDGMDSGIDKGKARSKQTSKNIFISSAFGYEPEENRIKFENIKDLTERLYEIVKKALSEYKSNKDILQLRKTILSETKKIYLKFLGETRRPANDITLWDHSYSVATLYKCALAKIVMYPSTVSFDPLDFDWKVLSVNLDILALLSKGIKIGDILGYHKLIKDLFNKIKEMIEEEYPIGNEIYRDTTGIYFLISDFEPNDLEIFKKEIKKKMQSFGCEELGLFPEILITDSNSISNNSKFDCNKAELSIPSEIKSLRKQIEISKQNRLLEILPKARKDAFENILYPASSSRFKLSFNSLISSSRREICPICRINFVKERADICENCLHRRERRIGKWLSLQLKTIWIDEIADHNDRVAIISCFFILDRWLDGTYVRTMTINNSDKTPLKNPSPARIRRIWNTTENFIKNTIKDILNSHSYGKDSPFLTLRRKRIQLEISPVPNAPKGSTIDIDIDGIRLSPVCIDNTKGIFITTTNLQILSNKGKTPEEIASWMIGKSIKIKKDGDTQWNEGYKITSASPADPAFQDYCPYIPIYDYPDQFIVLVPAYDALDIARKIFEEYKNQFSKVRNRLPFHLGIIAFHKRTPLYIAMDAAKRLIKALNTKTKTIDAEVKLIDNSPDSKRVKLVIKPSEDYSPVPLKWEISYSTGDPAQEDEWYPYFLVKEKPSNKDKYCFDYTGKGDYIVHVKKLNTNDKIKIDTSYLKLVFLESAADRFRIDDNLRPLDDIKRIVELWEDIQDLLKTKNIGLAQLYTFWQETKKRDKKYNGDPIWESFVKSSLINILKISPRRDKDLFEKFYQATIDDLLDICLYWNLRVRKQKPKAGG